MKLLHDVPVYIKSFTLPDKAIQKGKAIPVTGREGPQDCATSTLPHFLENRLTTGAEVVSHTRRQSFTLVRVA
jgi:hypothetical protein